MEGIGQEAAYYEPRPVISWRGKELRVNENVVNVVGDFAMRKELKLKEHKANGKIYKNKEDVEAATMGFTVTLLAGLGVDVEAEAAGWMEYCADGGRGEAGPPCLGGRF